jgi:hypothetical protein
VTAGLLLTAAACGQAGRSAGPGRSHGVTHGEGGAKTGAAHAPGQATAHAPVPGATTTAPTSHARSQVGGGGAGGAGGASTGSGAAASSGTPDPVTTSGFHGIYEFAGGNSAADAGNPNLAGVVLVFYWNQVEPQPGVYNWSLLQNDMAPWIAAGKKVILRISTSGEASWDPPYSAQGTPQWVFDQGTRAVQDNGETLPVYWDPAYLAAYRTFVTQLGQHFDGNPAVAFIEPGIGMGGETLPETNASSAGIAAWEADGYTNALWMQTVETVAGYFESAFHHTAVYPLIDRTFFDGDSSDIDSVMAWLRSVPGWGLQNDGLTATQTLSSDWSGAPLALEQLSSARSSGSCVCADMDNGLDKLHGSYLLIYQSDIDNPANAPYLSAIAARATASS